MFVDGYFTYIHIFHLVVGTEHEYNRTLISWLNLPLFCLDQGYTIQKHFDTRIETPGVNHDQSVFPGDSALMGEIVPRVDHLANHLEAIPEIVSWLHAEWGALMPDISYAKLISIFKERIISHKIPEILVALAGEEIIGTASIVQYDMSTRLDLSPWIAAVYVIPKYRGRGVGATLGRAILAEARFMDLDEIFLLTPDRTSFYERLGWKEFEKTVYRGENVTIMVDKIG